MIDLQKMQISDVVREMPSPWGPQIATDVEEAGSRAGRGGSDFVVRVTWESFTRRFAVHARARNTPRELALATERAREAARATGLPAMVVAPYIDETRMLELYEQEVSALDLSGNGLVVIPETILLWRSGQPNRFRQSRPSRFAYRGSTSIVPRLFLLRPSFRSVKEVRAELAARGAQVAASTVSKAIRRMEEDVLIARDDRGIVLMQPDELLDQLVKAFRPVESARTAVLRTDLPLVDVFRRCADRTRLALSGASSFSAYAAGARGDTPVIYCERMAAMRAALGSAWNETPRFSDLRILETRSKELFFDTRERDDGLIYASPIQACIELANGDTRDRQIAAQIRDQLMAGAHRQREVE